MKRIVHLKGFKPSICGAFAHLVFLRKIKQLLKNFTNFTNAFSLVEMLMALLVASLLMAALAPVMTRKMSESKVNVSGSLTDSIYHDYKVFTNPTTGDGDSANKEYEFEFPPNTDETDVTRFNAIIVSGGGGGAGAAASDVRGPKTLSYTQGVTGGSDVTIGRTELPLYTDYRFNRYTESIKLTIVSGAGGGGGGYGITKEEVPELNQTICASYGMGKTDTTGHIGSASSPIIVYDSANNMCVSAYNQISSGTRTSPSPSQPYCTTYAYNGFTTPICMKDGAFNACNEFRKAIGQNSANWRLPTESELSKWTASFVSKTVTNGGLGGCGWSSASGTQNCPSQYPSTIKQTHDPGWIWTSTPYTDTTVCIDSTRYYVYGLYNTSNWQRSGLCATTIVNTYKQYPGYTGFASVRCVLPTEPTKTFIPYSGGSGGGGSSVTITIPPEVLAKAIELSDDGRGVLRVHAGNGGQRAAGSHRSGYYGQASMVAVYPSTGAGTSAGAKLWHILVPGGGYGGRATATSGGTAGAAGGVKCSYYFPVSSGGKTTYGTDNRNSLSFNCSSLPGYISGIEGKAGEKGDKGLISPAGGEGGSKGGSGAVCSGTTDTTCNSGSTDGAGGSVTITYNVRIPGVGGSGGGAGSAARLVNVPVPAGRKIKISVGAGGLPGAAGASGKAGGKTSIEADGLKYYMQGGRGGSAATGGDIDSVTYNMPDSEAEPYLKAPGKAGSAPESITSSSNNVTKYFGGYNWWDSSVNWSPPTKGKLDTETGYRMRMSSGGNGGINHWTSLPHELPCGMFSNSDVVYRKSTLSCGLPGKPTPLTHGAANIFNMTGINNQLQFLGVGGGTGGGGGAWVKGVTPEAEGGAAGSSGYVVIYWGDSYNWGNWIDFK